MKKYELTSNMKEIAGHKLFQIKALKDFSDVKAGDLGGYIEKEENLSHDGNAWVYDKACVFENARIYDDAWICGDAKVFGNARIYGDAWVYDNAQVYANAEVHGNANINGNAGICVNAQVLSDADYICFKGFGSENRNTTMFKAKNGDVMVKCGCFVNNLKKFEEKVKETHGSSIYAKEYLACVEVAKIHFQIKD